jgi:predicted choloylglycine hydrolase
MRRRLFRIFSWFFLSLILLLVILTVYLNIVARAHPPLPAQPESLLVERQELANGVYTLGNNWFRKSETGLFELYVEGKPFERGVANGKLTKELVQYQEKVFNQQIHKLVPSDFYLTLLKYFVGWFNRDLEENVAEEYRQEILGVAQSASPDFDNIAPAYQRILNYHAAHDIGHALQNMSLVGCTSFAVWSHKSEDSTLLVARNFDFFVGDDFARDKIIAFYHPSDGYKFMMVTFGGMTGVLSGMNDQGLTVTINAAKSDIPSASATPVSLVAREILQYASTLDEAYAIAAKRHLFVSESFLIGSAKDKKAAIIEKTPEALDRVDPTGDFILCTNHFQSETLGNTQLNKDHMKTSASPYRWQRVDALLKSNDKISVTKAIGILRDQKGLDEKNIGMGNEKSINQLIAHHAVIFQPEKLRVWVSTPPWQLGRFVCYDLNKIFSLKATPVREIYEPALTVRADSFLLTKAFRDFIKFEPHRFPFLPQEGLQPDSLVTWNPESYLSYMLAGDAHFYKKDFAAAKSFYVNGLTREIATTQEREHMEKRLRECEAKLE